MISCIDEKVLCDGCSLQINTWKSDIIQPGKQMFQLALVNRGLTIQFPTNYEDFTKEQIKNRYDSIQSKKDFDNMRKKE